MIGAIIVFVIMAVALVFALLGSLFANVFNEEGSGVLMTIVAMVIGFSDIIASVVVFASHRH